MEAVRCRRCSIWRRGTSAPATDAGLLADSVRRLQSALTVEGDLIDCDAAMPERLLVHAWHAVHKKAAAFRKNIDRLTLKLNEILRADRAAPAARAPASLKASVGAPMKTRSTSTMSRLLQSVAGEVALGEARRQRIESTLQQLESQRFYAAPRHRAVSLPIR